MSDPLHVVTPIFSDPALDAALGREVWLKMECLQPTGSFKIRGIGLLCQELAAAGCAGFVSSSGGNAGYAVAYAGRALSMRVQVIVPSTTPAATRGKLEQLGATVRVFGDVWDEADIEARRLAVNGAAYVPPFDHPSLWRGHSTMIDEVAATHGKPDLVIATVGGGGLLCGVLAGLHNNGWVDVPVVAVETDGAQSFNAAIIAGKPVTLPAITSIAKSLGARRVCDAAFAWTQRHDIVSVVVPDEAAVRACLAFADRFRMLVEPACGAGLSLVYDDAQCVMNADKILVIVCGGIGVDVAQLTRWASDGYAQTAP